VVATHARTSSDPEVFVERDGIVYELFVSTLPSPAFTAADILELYLHRGSFETVLADEDKEQEMDRWYSHTPCGQEFAQILAQWVWNASSGNWDNSSLHLRCARPNVLPRMRLNLLQPMSLNLQQHRLPQSRMVHRNGLAHRLRMGFLAPHLRRNPMEASVALPTIRSI